MPRFINQTGASAIYNFIKSKGIKHVFGYTGGAVLPLTDKFHSYNNSKIKYIKNINELCVGHSAEGYAKVSRKPGIIITTSGPGVTNLITPLQNALSDGTPLIALSGQVSTNMIGTDAFQEAPSIELTKSCTKWNYRINDVNEIPDVMEHAYKVSMSGRKGPVFIDLPKNVLTETITSNQKRNYLSNIGLTSKIKKYKNTNIDDFINLLYVSEKPILYIGQGALEAVDEIRQFIKQTDIPFTTTIHGMGIGDETLYNSLHMLGMHGSVYANKAIQKADLIIAVGSRFDDRTTGNLLYYAPKAKQASKENRGGIVHFDISASQIDKTVKTDLSFLGDCKHYFKEINYKVNKTNINIANWNKEVLNLKKNNPFTYTPSSKKLKVQEVVSEIYKYTRDKKPYITTGVGNHQMYTAQFYRWEEPGRIITSGSLGTMGFGLPSAIGVQLYKPDDLVILIDGDGSFNMTSNDLATVAEHKLPIKMFIMNDSRQQMVHIWQKLFFDKKYISTDNFNPDYNKLADAYGIKNIILQKNNIQDIEKNINLNEPVLINCIIEPDMCTPLVAPGKALDDMILSETDNKMVGDAPN